VTFLALRAAFDILNLWKNTGENRSYGAAFDVEDHQVLRVGVALGYDGDRLGLRVVETRKATIHHSPRSAFDYPSEKAFGRLLQQVATITEKGTEMPTDFRDGKTFPRRGREALGDFLWLARVFDKARATTNGTQDGYIYPCPMDRAMMQRWGVGAREFTAAVGECSSDDQILAWLSERVTPDQKRAANAWLALQKDALDRHDAEEGVPGAVAPKLPRQEIMLGIAVAALTLLVAWITRLMHH
jgi:hypothetical protein